MEDARIARRYAQALFEIAVRNEVVASVEADLAAISKLLESDREFRAFFIAPYTSRAEKIAMADRLFSDRITALTMQLLRVMLEKGREAELQSVKAEFSDLRRNHEGILHAIVTSAHPLDEGQRKALVEKLERSAGKRFEAEFEVDARLMGGLKVAYGSYVLDGSVRGTLDHLRDRLRHDVLKQAEETNTQRKN